MKQILLATVASISLMLPAMAQNSSRVSPAPSQQQMQRIASSITKDEIRQIQISLNKAGFDAKNVDGIWGKDTKEAVRNFQQVSHLPGHGKLNQQTLSALGVTINNQSQASNSVKNRNGQQRSAASKANGQTQQAQTTGQASSNGRSTGSLNLTAQQKQMIAQNLSTQSSEQTPTNFEPRVGERVPQSLKLSPLPGKITSDVQSLKDNDFAKLNDGMILIVSPHSKQIAALVDDGVTTGTSNSSTNENVSRGSK